MHFVCSFVALSYRVSPVAFLTQAFDTAAAAWRQLELFSAILFLFKHSIPFTFNNMSALGVPPSEDECMGFKLEALDKIDTFKGLLGLVRGNVEAADKIFADTDLQEDMVYGLVTAASVEQLEEEVVKIFLHVTRGESDSAQMAALGFTMKNKV